MEPWTETNMFPGGTGSPAGETDLLYERMRQGSEGQCVRTPLVAEGMASTLERAPGGQRLPWGGIQRVVFRKNPQGVREAKQEKGGALTGNF